MRTGIIPDIHDKVGLAQHIMDTVPNVDQWVHLGDYFDDFPTGVKESLATAKKVKQWLADPCIVNILGNHDLSYGWGSNPQHRCSGFTLSKWKAIHSVLTWGDWQKFVLHYWLPSEERPILLSHAGLDKYFVPDVEDRITAIEAKINSAWFCLFDPVPANRGMGEELLGAGWDRGGRQAHGGILWCDWTNLTPPKGIDQIMGHTTIGSYPAIKQSLVHAKSTYTCYDLDTNLQHYAIVDDGVMSIHSVEDLPCR